MISVLAAILSLLLCVSTGVPAHSQVSTSSTERIQAIRQSAEKGDPGAQNNLGAAFERGLGVEQDFAQAAKWYMAAAKQGEAAAQSNLGSLHYRGLGAPKDFHEAAKWFKLSAQQENLSGMNNLARAYIRGEGVEEDVQEGLRLYRHAAAAGEPWAALALASMFDGGRHAPQNRETALMYYKVAAESGLPAGQASYANAFLFLRGDTPEARAHRYQWLLKAALGGHVESQHSVGRMLIHGNGVKQDFAAGKEWLQRAAAAGSDGAKDALKELRIPQPSSVDKVLLTTAIVGLAVAVLTAGKDGPTRSVLICPPGTIEAPTRGDYACMNPSTGGGALLAEDAPDDLITVQGAY